MAETSLWAYLKRGLKGRWHARRHECSISIGTSDVSYYMSGNGWIELKEVKALPARPGTGISLGQWHENAGAQRHFLIQRKGWLFVRVNRPQRMYLIFRYDNLPPWEREKRWNWAEFRGAAHHTWTSNIDFDMLKQILEYPS